MNRFFQVFAMMYATGGRRVDSMIRFSATCVSNVAIRQVLLQTAAQVEEGESLPQAFEEARYVTPSEKEVIASGDLSGTLERAFERIAFALHLLELLSQLVHVGHILAECWAERA